VTRPRRQRVSPEFPKCIASNSLIRALQAQHGDKIAELKELERAIEAAESAVEAGRDEIRLEAGEAVR
jgi:hypothetical protein